MGFNPRKEPHTVEYPRELKVNLWDNKVYPQNVKGYLLYYSSRVWRQTNNEINQQMS